jgi:hypothetical protein
MTVSASQRLAQKHFLKCNVFANFYLIKDLGNMKKFSKAYLVRIDGLYR